MSKKNENKKTRVFYVRISEYYKQFLVSRYGNLTPKEEIATVYFPIDSPYSEVIASYLVSNIEMKKVSPNSFSDNAFNTRVYFNEDAYLPKIMEKPQFIAVVMPDKVRKGWLSIDTNGYWQLSRLGVGEFNKMVKREFWRACMTFIDDCFHYAKIQHRKMTRENAISDFMMAYQIPMRLYENIYRYEKRFRKEAVREIQEKRADLEKMNDVELFYTS